MAAINGYFGDRPYSSAVLLQTPGLLLQDGNDLNARPQAIQRLGTDFARTVSPVTNTTTAAFGSADPFSRNPDASDILRGTPRSVASFTVPQQSVTPGVALYPDILGINPNAPTIASLVNQFIGTLVTAGPVSTPGMPIFPKAFGSALDVMANTQVATQNLIPHLPGATPGQSVTYPSPSGKPVTVPPHSIHPPYPSSYTSPFQATHYPQFFPLGTIPYPPTTPPAYPLQRPGYPVAYPTFPNNAYI